MAKQSVDQPVMLMEVQRVDRPGEREPRTVQQLDRLPGKSLQQAKAQFGAAVKAAIGDEPFKVYGDESYIGKVVSGEKVPDYIGRLYQNDGARRRLARELLRGDAKVRRRVSLEWDEEIG